MSKKTIRVSATVIKEALADYFNNIDANLELVGKDFKLKDDANRKLFWAVRKETSCEVYDRGGCPCCSADKKHVKDEKSETPEGVIIDSRCTKCGALWEGKEND